MNECVIHDNPYLLFINIEIYIGTIHNAVNILLGHAIDPTNNDLSPEIINIKFLNYIQETMHLYTICDNVFTSTVIMFKDTNGIDMIIFMHICEIFKRIQGLCLDIQAKSTFYSSIDTCHHNQMDPQTLYTIENLDLNLDMVEHMHIDTPDKSIAPNESIIQNPIIQNPIIFDNTNNIDNGDANYENYDNYDNYENYEDDYNDEDDCNDDNDCNDEDDCNDDNDCNDEDDCNDDNDYNDEDDCNDEDDYNDEDDLE